MEFSDFFVGAIALFVLHSLVRFTLQKDWESHRPFRG